MRPRTRSGEARALASHGATITVLARSEESRGLSGAQPACATVESGVVDLGDLASIRAFADMYLETMT